jgi:hypothetical protein
MKELMTKQLLKTAEKHKLIAKTQMRAHTEHFTETALDLLTEQIHTVWNSGKFVITLLSLNISEAFDTVLTVQLLNILRKKEISEWTVRWIKTFLTNCTTSLMIQEQKTASFRINNEISRIVFYSYCFYSTTVRFWNYVVNSKRLSAIEFADDVNMLSYKRITEINCKNLEQTHERCMKWARQHEMRFASQKYELIHFIRAYMKFNMQISIHLQDTEKTSTKNVQVLKIWLNCKLNWKAHLNHILKRWWLRQKLLYN